MLSILKDQESFIILPYFLPNSLGSLLLGNKENFVIFLNSI